MSSLTKALFAALAISSVASILHCGSGGSTYVIANDGGLAGADGSTVAEGLPDIDRPLVPASKLDLLLAIDNSATMSDKAEVLASSIGALLRDLARVGDVHVGVVSSSLGNLGGDVCDANNARTNDRGHLLSVGPGGTPVAGLTNGVLAYNGGDVEAFVTSAQNLIRGVDQIGCGFEAQLESVYHFLVQPDPWDTVKLDASNLADLGTGIDSDILAQRKSFLRPDSALVVLMLTDEDDSSADPLAVGGQGWAFMAKNFPGSKVNRVIAQQGTTAPRGTSTCATNPASEDCTSCAFQSLCDASQPACQKIKNDPNCQSSGVPGQSGEGYNGYYAPADDELNVRFSRMKERYGVDPQYPISRYVDGFSKSVVPNRVNEHVIHTNAGRREIDPYTGVPNCTNPIFAATLPGSASEELCTLDRGPRSRELVVFTLIGGLPAALAGATPDYTKLLGANPDAYDFSGIDPHMIQSTEPRPTLGGSELPRGNNGTDPTNGREWLTNKSDLQFACTFDLPSERVCAAGGDPSCICNADEARNPPLCSGGNTQIKGRAYPTPRELRVAKGLGGRAIVGSTCAKDYASTMTALSSGLVSRVKP